MEKLISVKFPSSLANSLKLAENEFEREIKTLSIIKLYELGKISSGKASKILGINRTDFIEMAGKYKVPVFQFEDEDELDEDIKNA